METLRRIDLRTIVADLGDVWAGLSTPSKVAVGVASLAVGAHVVGSVGGRVKKWLALRGLPEPPGSHWLYGHAKEFDDPAAAVEWLRNLGRYGPATKIRLGWSEFVVLTSAESCRLALAKPNSKDMMNWHFFKLWLGESVLTSDGSKWARSRKLLTPIFHFEILKSYIEHFSGEMKHLLSQWEEASANNESIDVWEGMSDFTMSALLNCLFGGNQISEADKRTFNRCNDEIGRLFVKRMANVAHHYDAIYRLSSNGRAFMKAVRESHAITRRLLSKRRQELEENKELQSKKDLVTLLLLAKDEDGKGFSDTEVLHEILTILFAGHDTTGVALPFILGNLAAHPEHQDRCRKEINDIMHDREQITWDDLTRMNYLTMAVKESLRMHGPIISISHRLTHTITLPDGTVLPKGIDVIYAFDAIHYDPDVWTNPEKFDPTRFDVANWTDRHSHAFIPFSAGPRNCLGQNFAMKEMLVFLATTLRRFRLTPDPKRPTTVVLATLRRAKDGVWLNFAPI